MSSSGQPSSQAKLLKPDTYWRLMRARELIDHSYQLALDLEKISRVACLSRLHFLRLFRAAYSRVLSDDAWPGECNIQVRLAIFEKREDQKLSYPARVIGGENMLTKMSRATVYVLDQQ